MAAAQASANAEIRGAAALLPGVVASAMADASWTRYASVWSRFRQWCEDVEVPALPARPVHVACFLIRVTQSSTTFSNVKTTRAAIRKFHEAAGCPTPTEHTLVQFVSNAARRLLPGVLRRKAPLTLAHVQRMVDRVPDYAPLPLVRRTAAILVGFFGFFQYSDLAQIWADWVCFFDGRMEIFLEWRKNDQFREGHWIAVA
ncbi:MAG: hypothetical protein MI867_25415, partial [Pseudomonadales bacterium]|nr:hypothetical protein [Pseudomonadales bacterium]